MLQDFRSWLIPPDVLAVLDCAGMNLEFDQTIRTGVTLNQMEVSLSDYGKQWEKGSLVVHLHTNTRTHTQTYTHIEKEERKRTPCILREGVCCRTLSWCLCSTFTGQMPLQFSMT